jgi:hypothetical protein
VKVILHDQNGGANSASLEPASFQIFSGKRRNIFCKNVLGVNFISNVFVGHKIIPYVINCTIVSTLTDILVYLFFFVCVIRELS